MPSKKEVLVQAIVDKSVLPTIASFRGLANEFPVEIAGVQYESGMIHFETFRSRADSFQQYSGNLVFVVLKTPSATVADFTNLLSLLPIDGEF